MTLPRVQAAKARTGEGYRRRETRSTSLFAHGEPMVWLTGGSLVLCLGMIAWLLGYVGWKGSATFWPQPVVQIETLGGERFMGEVTESEEYRPEENVFEALPPEIAETARARVTASDGLSTRRQLRTGNFELTNTHFRWSSDFLQAAESRPEWALVVERLAWGRFYGELAGFLIDGEAVTSDAAEAWALYREHHPTIVERRAQRKRLENHDIGLVNARQERARLAVREAELEHGEGSPEAARAAAHFERVEAESQEAYDRIRREIDALNETNARYALRLATADGAEKTIELADVVRTYPANRLGFADRVAIYFSRWGEFLTAEPREANSEGGVFPAIFGTVVMTLVMSILVVPFGVFAALYLHEYARQGWLVSTVRIAVGNLAGVPSIVFGVFGLGFFCYIIGASIDELLFSATLPNPTFGKGGLLWASLTLALLTLPVVIVATEEALAAVPNSMREGSFACGATKWQTIRRIVLPRALPGILTGMILAIARGAGEVAPLMLVGAVKLAPELPIDLEAPFVHGSRSFMHLGFHIYDIGFQSPNSEAAKPMVFTTTLLLIAIVVALNVLAIWVRGRLRRRFEAAR